MQNSIDPFERLPNELVILIVTKLPHDLKFLMQCFLVSHQFASAILHVPSVKLNLPLGSWLTDCNNFESFKAQIKNSESFNASSLFSKTNNLLNKFLDLRFLHLVFPEYMHESRSMFYYIKMKVETDSYTLVYIQSDLDCGLNGNSNYSGSKSVNYVKLYTMMVFWCNLIFTFIKGYPMLQSVKISSLNSCERICIKGEELINLKNLNSRGQSRNFKTGIIRLPALRVSGNVMHNVFLGVRHGREGDKLPEIWDDIKGWDYGEGEDDKVFGQAINSIFMNHRDKFIWRG